MLACLLLCSAHRRTNFPTSSQRFNVQDKAGDIVGSTQAAKAFPCLRLRSNTKTKNTESFVGRAISDTPPPEPRPPRDSPAFFFFFLRFSARLFAAPERQCQHTWRSGRGGDGETMAFTFLLFCVSPDALDSAGLGTPKLYLRRIGSEPPANGSCNIAK